MFSNPFKKMDQETLRHSSDLLNKQKNYNKVINLRISIAAVAVLCVFGIIAFRLFDIQYRNHDSYTLKLENFASKKQKTVTPRGQILDRNGNVVVATKESLNITYTPPEELDEETIWENAIHFYEHFGKADYEPTNQEYQSLYLQLSDDNGDSLLSEEEQEKVAAGTLSEAKAEQLKLSRVNEEMIASIPESYRNAYGIKLMMQKSPASETKLIKENVSNEQVAYLSEHTAQFEGFDVSNGWMRDYPYADTLKDVIGRIGTIQEQDQLYYQALGYGLNEMVGISGLELEYEDLLSGKKMVNEITYDESGNAQLNEVSAGKKGYDLQLSIDIELQQKIDEILLNTMRTIGSNETSKYMRNLFVTLINPQDGSIYAMSGVQKDEEGNIYLYASGNYLSANLPGSAVKPAVVYMGLAEGAVSPGEIIVDEPLYIKGSAPKGSYRNYGPLDEIGALQVSSNVYMFHIAIRLGHGTYVKNGPLDLDTSAYSLIRRYYSMFGLGTKTGIDLPNEEIGVRGTETSSGLLLDYVIGQYESYTTLQLAQYTATVANGGKRMKPRLVTQAYEVNSRNVVYQNKSEILNYVNGDRAYFDRVHLGMRTCVTTNYCGNINRSDVQVAAKTGTAENKYYKDGVGYDSPNAIQLGYAPYDSDTPNLAFACMAPNYSNGDKLQPNICGNTIMPQVLEEFYKKY